MSTTGGGRRELAARRRSRGGARALIGTSCRYLGLAALVPAVVAIGYGRAGLAVPGRGRVAARGGLGLERLGGA